MIRGIHHVALNTANFDRMLHFYRDGLGFKVVYEIEWADNETIDDIIDLPNSAARSVMLAAGNAHLELFEYSSPAARESDPLRPCDRGYTHFCLDVTDIEAECERLSKAGMTFKRKPVGFGEITSIYGKDPDGNIIEIQEISDRQNPIAFEQLQLLNL